MCRSRSDIMFLSFGQLWSRWCLRVLHLWLPADDATKRETGSRVPHANIQASKVISLFHSSRSFPRVYMFFPLSLSLSLSLWVETILVVVRIVIDFSLIHFRFLDTFLHRLLRVFDRHFFLGLRLETQSYAAKTETWSANMIIVRCAGCCRCYSDHSWS